MASPQLPVLLLQTRSSRASPPASTSTPQLWALEDDILLQRRLIPSRLCSRSVDRDPLVLRVQTHLCCIRAEECCAQQPEGCNYRAALLSSAGWTSRPERRKRSGQTQDLLGKAGIDSRGWSPPPPPRSGRRPQDGGERWMNEKASGPLMARGRRVTGGCLYPY